MKDVVYLVVLTVVTCLGLLQAVRASVYQQLYVNYQNTLESAQRTQTGARNPAFVCRAKRKGE